MELQNQDPREFIWEQRWRPSLIEDIIIPHATKEMLLNYSAEGRIPSFIFYSPSPGTGKTTTAVALARSIGCEKPLLVNASLDTSIDVIRDRVLQYSTTVSVVSSAAQKVVILDECERLSPAAQESLKGIMEKVSKNCSFILTTNNINRVVKPLVSRCRRVDFIWNQEETKDMIPEMCKRVVEILKHENVQYDPKAVLALVKRYFPDNRSTIGMLQDYAQRNGKIDLGIVNTCAGEGFDELIKFLKNGDFKSVTQWAMDNQDRIGEDFYGKFFRFVYPDERIRSVVEPKVAKTSVPHLVLILAENQKYHRNVADPFVHLVSALTQIMTSPDIKFM